MHEVIQKLEINSIPEPNTGCWLWTGATFHKGHGAIRFRGTQWKAHRVSWTANIGEIPQSMCVLHKCDTPCCINPRHLFLGTKGDNNRDRTAKNRGAKGSRMGTSKLKESDVQIIKQRLRQGATAADLGKEFGVSNVAVSQIRLGRTWRHVA
jgi:hypothetical protein